MRKITIEDLTNKIRKNISSGELTTYCITDDPLCVCEGKKEKKKELLDVQKKDEYDTIFEKLNQSLWSNKKMVFWNTDGNGTYKGILSIDSTVIVEFKYRTLEGQAWLYQRYKEN